MYPNLIFIIFYVVVNDLDIKSNDHLPKIFSKSFLKRLVKNKSEIYQRKHANRFKCSQRLYYAEALLDFMIANSIKHVDKSDNPANLPIEDF